MKAKTKIPKRPAQPKIQHRQPGWHALAAQSLIETEMAELRRLLAVPHTHGEGQKGQNECSICDAGLLSAAIKEIKGLRVYREQALAAEVRSLGSLACIKALQVLDKRPQGLRTADMDQLIALGLVRHMPIDPECFEATDRCRELAPYMRTYLGQRPTTYTIVWVDMNHNAYVYYQDAYSPYEAVDLAMVKEDKGEPSEPYTIAGVFAGKLDRLYHC